MNVKALLLVVLPSRGRVSSFRKNPPRTSIPALERSSGGFP
jgi:hypothetical protein